MPLQGFASFLAPFLSGILLALASPNHHLGWLAWLAFFPLLLAIHEKKALGGLSDGLVLWVIFLYWHRLVVDQRISLRQPLCQQPRLPL